MRWLSLLSLTCALATMLGCADRHAASVPPTSDYAIATLSGPAADLTVDGKTAYVVGFFWAKSVDLETGKVQRLPGLDDARWLEWIAPTRLDLPENDVFHEAGGNGYFPLADPTNYDLLSVAEVNFETGAIREFPGPSDVREFEYLGWDDEALYVETGFRDVRLYRIDPSVGDWEPVGPSWGSVPDGGPIAADANAVYFGTGLQSDTVAPGTIRWEKATNTFTSFRTVGSFPERVAVDGGFVYIAGQYDGEPGISIYRFPVGGGKPKTLVLRTASDPVISGLVVDDQDVYWLDQRTLHRVPKDGGQDEVLANRDLPGLERSLRLTASGVAWLDGTEGESDAGDLVTSVCVYRRRAAANP